MGMVKAIVTEIQIKRAPRTAAVGNWARDILAVAARVPVARAGPGAARLARAIFARVVAGEVIVFVPVGLFSPRNYGVVCH